MPSDQSMTDQPITDLPERVHVARMGPTLIAPAWSEDPEAVEYVRADLLEKERERAERLRGVLQAIYEDGCAHPGDPVEHGGLTIVSRCGRCLSCIAEAALAADPRNPQKEG